MNFGYGRQVSKAFSFRLWESSHDLVHQYELQHWNIWVNYLLPMHLR